MSPRFSSSPATPKRSMRERARVMALLLYRSDVSMNYFGLNRDQACALQEQYRLRSLLDMRENIAESLFELAAYDNPSQDLAALYNQLQTQYLGVDFHPGCLDLRPVLWLRAAIPSELCAVRNVCQASAPDDGYQTWREVAEPRGRAPEAQAVLRSPP